MSARAFNIDHWLSGEEGTRVVEAAARAVFDSEVVGPLDALVDEQPVRDIVTAALRAALSLTTTCATCGGTGVAGHHHGPGLDCDSGCNPGRCRFCKGGTVPGEPAILSALVELVAMATGTGEALFDAAIEQLPAWTKLYRLRPLEKEDET